MKLRPSLLALSLITTITHTAQAEEFNETVFFGDSLSDSGYFTNFNANLGKFTTNPDKVWTEALAEAYGTKAIANSNGVDGNNYAAGGALSSTDIPQHPDLGVPVPSAKTQVETYLANHTPNSTTLYSVWAGANDFLGAMADPSNAQAAVTTAAKDTAKTVQTLADAGAEYIIVPNMPDVGKSPLGLLSGKSDLLTQLASFHNHTLYSALNQGTANVIPVDTFSMIQEVAADPASYGIINTTGVACGFDADGKPNDSITCNRNNLPVNADKYLFADSVHPTGAVHAILAEYVQSVLQSPSKFAQVGNTLSQTGWRQNTQIHRRLNQLTPNTDGIWSEAGISNHTSDYAGEKIDSDKIGTNGIIGFGIGGNQSNTGMYIQLENSAYQNNDDLTFDITQKGFGIYHKHYLGDYTLNAHAGIDRLGIDWERDIGLNTGSRKHTAEGSADKKHLALQVQREFRTDNVRYTPYIGGMIQKLDVNSLAEDNANLSTAMQFDGYSQDSLIGEVGIKANFPLSNTLDIEAGVRFSHDFDHEDDKKINANLASTNTGYNRGFALPVASTDENQLGLSVGLNRQLANGLSMQIGATADGSGADNLQTGAYLGINAKY